MGVVRRWHNGGRKFLPQRWRAIDPKNEFISHLRDQWVLGRLSGAPALDAGRAGAPVLDSGRPRAWVSWLWYYALGDHGHHQRRRPQAAFVSSAANVSKEDLEKIDLLPKIQHKVLVTPELALIFRGQEDELADKFNTLIHVLDGQGLSIDSGT
jgi:hypothetical protein